ncbi:MAG: J domain-containing protein, partial [Planctomycetes bacterium]|nr:J domain-containing protein [Planctomycetota bacterium]
MRSPWQVLGLQPGCSQGEIRAAYARLLKLHRPDVDPVAFREIRDAYEWLRDAGWPAGASAEPREEPGEQRDELLPLPASVNRANVPPEELQSRSDRPEGTKPTPRRRRPSLSRRLRQALQRRRPEPQRLSRVLRVLLSQWRHTAAMAWDLSPLIVLELQLDGAPVRRLLGAEDVRVAIERGDVALIDEMLQAHIVADDHE